MLQKMRVHCLEHVSFEGPANIQRWADKRGYHFSSTKFHDDERLPSPAFDLLIIMGGPMGVHDESEYPWLVEEKAFIDRVIEEGTPVVGVCLGAQLIAEVLGGNVDEHDVREIGWYPVRATEHARRSPVFGSLPAEYMAFHWHGDTFELPDGALRMAESDACGNQAFEYDNKVIGLQFHLESTLTSVIDIVRNSELGDGPWVQKEEELHSGGEHLIEMQQHLYTLLDNFTNQFR